MQEFTSGGQIVSMKEFHIFFHNIRSPFYFIFWVFPPVFTYFSSSFHGLTSTPSKKKKKTKPGVQGFLFSDRACPHEQQHRLAPSRIGQISPRCSLSFWNSTDQPSLFFPVGSFWARSSPQGLLEASLQVLRLDGNPLRRCDDAFFPSSCATPPDDDNSGQTDGLFLFHAASGVLF